MNNRQQIKPVYEITGWSIRRYPSKTDKSVYIVDYVNKSLHRTSSQMVAFFVRIWYNVLYDKVEEKSIK